jgi:hypothetical protein
MPINQHHIDELRQIYREEFGEEISNEEAWEMCTRLVNLYRLLLDAEIEQEKVRTS